MAETLANKSKEYEKNTNIYNEDFEVYGRSEF